jgi:tetratricopeptide (TPR) repeat protein
MAEELAEKAKDQRQRGQLEEAMISARHAATLDPKNANAFWQLALCQLDLNGPAKALEPLARVTELAPRFAYGWTKLGLSLQKTGEDDRARECFEKAIELEPDETAAPSQLASIYERDEQPDDEIRVLLALEDLVDLTPYQMNRLASCTTTRRTSTPRFGTTDRWPWRAPGLRASSTSVWSSTNPRWVSALMLSTPGAACLRKSPGTIGR